ncbi:YkgJ family cysteine cluster protein [Pseudooceanicola nitratireducens]|uniref:YkgJ family cysteine cluster protein n=1 Tax=Pseudooceanicola nitratireducens TaxID=517719 RepID=UPI0035134872
MTNPKTMPIQTLSDLSDRLNRAAPDTLPESVATRARALLAPDPDTPLPQQLEDLRTGALSVRIAANTRADLPAFDAPLACAPGCAFCCLIPDGDGGLITQAEAERMHSALAPLAGQPDGRAWHPDACAALDPETRLCRAYDARPNICRAFFSFDAAACEIIADGGDADGSAITGDHLDYLATLAIARSALGDVPTYALQQLTIATVEGADCATALAAARHDDAELDATCDDFFYDIA